MDVDVNVVGVVGVVDIVDIEVDRDGKGSTVLNM